MRKLLKDKILLCKYHENQRLGSVTFYTVDPDQRCVQDFFHQEHPIFMGGAWYIFGSEAYPGIFSSGTDKIFSGRLKYFHCEKFFLPPLDKGEKRFHEEGGGLKSPKIFPPPPPIPLKCLFRGGGRPMGGWTKILVVRGWARSLNSLPLPIL